MCNYSGQLQSSHSCSVFSVTRDTLMLLLSCHVDTLFKATVGCGHEENLTLRNRAMPFARSIDFLIRNGATLRPQQQKRLYLLCGAWHQAESSGGRLQENPAFLRAVVVHREVVLHLVRYLPYLRRSAARASLICRAAGYERGRSGRTGSVVPVTSLKKRRHAVTELLETG